MSHFAERFREQLSKPQYQYLVTVLLGLMLCEGKRTLSGLVHQIADGASVAGLSRFLAQAPWDAQAVEEQWMKHRWEEMQPMVETECQRQGLMQPKRRGRPKQPLVTGYLIGDHSTMHMPKGKKKEGLGQRHSTTEDRRLPGHSMIGLYVLRGHRCPLAPQMYRQLVVCETEGVPFASKIELMEARIRSFEPIAGIVTHVLLDS